MAKTLFDIKNDLVTIGNAYAAAKQAKLEEASKPEASIENIKALETKEKNLKDRFDILQREHDEMAEAQASALVTSAEGGGDLADPKAKKCSKSRANPRCCWRQKRIT